MKQLFEQRRQAFHRQLLKYLPYVFNDHFVLVLMIGLGALLLQYHDLLQHLPKDKTWLYLGLGLYMTFLVGLGRLATYVEQADKTFLLAKESELITEVHASYKRGLVFWNSIQSFLLLLATPLFLALQAGRYFLMFLLILHTGKWLLFKRKLGQWVVGKTLKWDDVIAQETNRQQSVLRFFSLFTTVKGLKSITKPRAYLNGFLNYVPKRSELLYFNLFARAFLRVGDYLGIYLRILIITGILVWCLPYKILAAAIGAVGLFLWEFQLLSLYKHFDYQYLLLLAPTKLEQKRLSLLKLLRLLTLPHFLLMFILLADWSSFLLFLAVGLVMNYFYFPHKLKVLID